MTIICFESSQNFRIRNILDKFIIWMSEFNCKRSSSSIMGAISNSSSASCRPTFANRRDNFWGAIYDFRDRQLTGGGSPTIATRKKIRRVNVNEKCRMKSTFACAKIMEYSVHLFILLHSVCSNRYLRIPLAQINVRPGVDENQKIRFDGDKILNF